MHAMERMAVQVASLIRTLQDVVAVRRTARMKCLARKGIALVQLSRGTPIGQPLSLIGSAGRCDWPQKTATCRISSRKGENQDEVCNDGGQLCCAGLQSFRSLLLRSRMKVHHLHLEDTAE
jgi:hypothetical protein